MEIVLRVLFVVILNIIEAYTDFFIIKDSKGYGRKWHKTDAVYYLLIILGFGLMSIRFDLSNISDIDWKFMLLLITGRYLIFNSLLNKLRKKDYWYRGEKGIDGILKPYSKIVWLISIALFVFNVIILK